MLRKKKRDELVDQARGRSWFWKIKVDTGVTEPREIERLFRPDVTPRNNRFGEFDAGLRSPSISAIKRGEELAPGSEREVNQVLWKVIRFEYPDIEAVSGWQKIHENQISDWIGQINPDLMSVVTDKNRNFYTTISKQYLRKIELRASSDSLAVLVILFRIYQGQKENSHAWDIAHSIFRMLIVLGDEFSYRGIDEQMWEIFEKRVFQRVTLKNEMIDLERAKREFFIGVPLLALIAEAEQNSVPISKQKNIEHYSARILRKELRKDLNGFIELPRCVIKHQTNPPTKALSADSPMIADVKKYLQNVPFACET